MPMLVHICCAPCGSASVLRVMEAGYAPYLYYANSNIYPREEYTKRQAYVRKLAEYFQLPLIEEPWDHESWLEQTAHLADEPEGGNRCTACFSFSLSLTSRKARELDIPNFTTTLTISPHKSSKQIFAVGSEFEGFSSIDFKKQEGYAKSIALSRELGFYRQSYCGCEFSLEQKKSASS